MKSFILCCLGSLLVAHATAGPFQQPDPAKQLIEKINKWYAVPREEIFLVTNRSDYQPGDTIWFKAFVVKKKDLTPSDQSNLVHAALVSTKGVVMESLLLRLDANHFNGYFILPDHVATGNFYLVAYTNWMLNFPGNDYALKPLGIGRTPLGADEGLEPRLSGNHIHFYPESGQLVGGYSNLVAFKCTDSSGGPVQVSGYIKNDKGSDVTDYTSNGEGLGSFQIPVSSRRKFIAYTLFPNGHQQIDTLVRPASEGYIIHTNPSVKDRIGITVVPGDSIASSTRTLLTVLSGGKICYAAYGINGYAVQVPTNSLRPGIARITVFSMEGKPLTERFIYLAPPRVFTPSVQAGQVAGSPEISVTIQGSAASVNDISGNFFLVAGDSAILASQGCQLEIPIPLTDNGGGQDKFTFPPTNSAGAPDMDLRLLTSHWTGPSWDEILGDNQADYPYSMEFGQVIGGKVLDAGTPVPNRQISLISRTGGPTEVDTTDRNGRFLFTNLTFKDSSVFLLSFARDKKRTEKSVSFIIDSTSAFRLPQDFQLPSDGDKGKLSTANRTSALHNPPPPDLKVSLDTVHVKDNHYLNRRHDANVITSDELMKFTDLFQALGMLNGVQVTEINGNYHIIIGGISSFHNQSDPLAIVDDVELPDISELYNLSTTDIDSVIVLRGDALYGARGMFGVIKVYLKKTALVQEQVKNDHIHIYIWNGYEKQVIAPSRYRVGDHFLYWDGDVQADSSGILRTVIPFRDKGENDQAILQGITDSGTPIFLRIPLKNPAD
jgi:hypothetical protein